MAQVNFNVTQGQYDAMMTVLNGLRAKLGANKDVLTRVLSTENGQAKIKAFAASQNPPWLRKVKQARDDLNTFFENVGRRDD